MYKLHCEFVHRPEVFSTSTTETLWTDPRCQLALGGRRLFSTSASEIIIIIGSTGHS